MVNVVCPEAQVSEEGGRRGRRGLHENCGEERCVGACVDSGEDAVLSV